MPGKLFLAVFKSPTSVHAEPFHSSVIAKLAVLPFSPAKTKQASAVAPQPAIRFLPVFKSATSVQDDPFHSSVIALEPGLKEGTGYPPNANADV